MIIDLPRSFLCDELLEEDISENVKKDMARHLNQSLCGSRDGLRTSGKRGGSSWEELVSGQADTIYVRTSIDKES